MIFKYSLLLVAIGCLGLIEAQEKPKLRGAVVVTKPFVAYNEADKKFSGLLVEVMDIIVDKLGIEYELYTEASGAYGMIKDKDINGIIGEVYHKRADFALADLTITEARHEYVDFTYPFLMNRMSGLLRTDDSMGIVSLDHLIEINNQTDGKSSVSLKFGVLKGGSTRHFISTSDHPLVVRLNQYFLQHPEDLVNTIKEGVERAAQGGYVMLMESSNAEYVANSMCQMRVLYDTVNMRQGFGYGIALPKNSTYLEPFSKVIVELETSGTLRSLLKRYYTSKEA